MTDLRVGIHMDAVPLRDIPWCMGVRVVGLRFFVEESRAATGEIGNDARGCNKAETAVALAAQISKFQSGLAIEYADDVLVRIAGDKLGVDTADTGEDEDCFLGPKDYLHLCSRDFRLLAVLVVLTPSPVKNARETRRRLLRKFQTPLCSPLSPEPHRPQPNGVSVMSCNPAYNIGLWNMQFLWFSPSIQRRYLSVLSIMEAQGYPANIHEARNDFSLLSREPLICNVICNYKDYQNFITAGADSCLSSKH
ncbi:hypothetical protein BDN70DRAFT_892838 [Pholiota conissans]|uniref:Uncharacterized protein n=1 Tax=Pholiota conissans TaxID=109636 RepID=A0A9P6D3E3_9AGAR|nr:hypothetical protein BDN70DRAFT_892838 [Pholiota conissans]